MIMSRRSLSLLLGALASVSLLASLLILNACGSDQAPFPAPTRDLRALETQVTAKLAATLTAKAPPTATLTPWPVRPTSTSVPRATATPTLALPLPESGEQLAYVRVLQDSSTNIVLSDEAQQAEQLLTHFVEKQNMCDLDWAPDGQMLVFVSAHDFVHSRSNERNVFIMRADGTGLRMVTGDYVDPQAAAGPYVTLSGKVSGCEGVALVSAQGVPAPAATDPTGAFELIGVPVSARWARAICPGGAYVLQGDVDLALTEGVVAPVSLEVQATGQGWTQAALSPDGKTAAGIAYRWVLDAEGEQEHRSVAFLQGVENDEGLELPLPEGMSITSVAWSPWGDAVVGALTGPKGAYLWRWDAQGNDLGELLAITNPDDVIYSLHDIAWSPAGNRLAFSRKGWDWWGEERYKADLMVVTADGQDPTVLLEGQWGQAATHPTWAEDGQVLFYQVAIASAGNGCATSEGDIMRVRLAAENGETPTPEPWRADRRSSLPVVRPQPAVTPTPAEYYEVVLP